MGEAGSYCCITLHNSFIAQAKSQIELILPAVLRRLTCKAWFHQHLPTWVTALTTTNRYRLVLKWCKRSDVNREQGPDWVRVRRNTRVIPSQKTKPPFANALLVEFYIYSWNGAMEEQRGADLFCAFLGWRQSSKRAGRSNKTVSGEVGASRNTTAGVEQMEKNVCFFVQPHGRDFPPIDHREAAETKGRGDWFQLNKYGRGFYM